MRRLEHELRRVKNFKSKFVKLMGAWPIWRLNIILAGPARMSRCQPVTERCVTFFRQIFGRLKIYSGVYIWAFRNPKFPEPKTNRDVPLKNGGNIWNFVRKTSQCSSRSCLVFSTLNMTWCWPYAVRFSNVCAIFVYRHALESWTPARSEKKRKKMVTSYGNAWLLLTFLKACGWLRHL